MTKKWLRLLAAILALGLLAAACGSDDSDDSSSDDGENSSDSGGDTASGDDAAIEWMTRPDNPEEAAVYGSISDQLDGELEGVTLT